MTHSLLLFEGNMGTGDIITHLRPLDPSEPFWDEPFGMTRRIAGDLHRSLRVSFGDYSQPFDLCYLCVGVCKCELSSFSSSCDVIASPSGAVFQTSVSSVTSILICCVLVRPDGGVSVGWMTVSPVETMTQAYVPDGLSGFVTCQQASVSQMPSQFDVISVPADGSSAEVVLPGSGSSRQSQILRAPGVANLV